MTQPMHSALPDKLDVGSAAVQIIPQLQDNFAYLLIDNASNEAALVDPAQPQHCLSILQQYYPQVKLTHILTTHKHWDHAGGNRVIARVLPSITVVGGLLDEVESCTLSVQHNDTVTIGENTVIQVKATPCHTRGHVSYYFQGQQGKQGVVFTGDTLFLAGVGKFFEGSAEDMYNSIYNVLCQLPDSTIVLCGHEYTLDNLKFAAFIEPDNTLIEQRLETVTQLRQHKHVTVGTTTVGHEKQSNVFMRCHLPHIQQRMHIHSKSAIETLAALRRAKDQKLHLQTI